jgi:hypothetical protein
MNRAFTYTFRALTAMCILLLMSIIVLQFMDHRLPARLQSMKDSIQADTPIAPEAATALWSNWSHPTEKIPTEEDSLRVSLEVSIWHSDTIRLWGLPPGSRVKVTYLDRHGYIVDTVDDDSSFTYPHALQHGIRFYVVPADIIIKMVSNLTEDELHGIHVINN